jgi:regulator of replication initiation timing
MTLNEFVIKWQGKNLDFDGAYGYQCMDLMHQYNVDVLGLSNGAILAAPWASDLYNKFETLYGHENFEKIANTPTNVPQEGDIMVWGTKPYGHVAIFIEGDVNSFRSFDENYPTGTLPHVQSHTYANVLGWLRFKGENVYQVGHEVIQNSDNWITILQKYNFPNNKDVVCAEIDKLLTLEDKLLAKSNELENYRGEAQKTISELKASIETASKENEGLRTDCNDLQREVSNQSAIIATLKGNIDNLESVKPITQYGKWELLTEFFKRMFT